jgi:hypothetical protein
VAFGIFRAEISRLLKVLIYGTYTAIKASALIVFRHCGLLPFILIEM